MLGALLPLTLGTVGVMHIFRTAYMFEPNLFQFKVRQYVHSVKQLRVNTCQLYVKLLLVYIMDNC